MKNNKLIIDVGMHIGRDTEFYLLKGFDVVAIEANPQLAAEGSQKFAPYIESGQLKILNIGVTETEGSFSFYINPQKDDWSSFEKDWNKSMWAQGTEIQEVTIQGLPTNKIIEQVGTPYYLKIDIEGNDAACLKGLKNVKDLPQFISVELQTYNNLPDQENNYLEIFCELIKLGYKKFKIIDQGANHLVKPPQPAKEGIYTDYQFDGHCSGLFGEELPGEWMNADKAIYNYLYYLNNHHLPLRTAPLRPLWKRILKPRPEDTGTYYEGALNKNSWFDVHASL